MRNNVNNNGLINGGYTTNNNNNQNVNQLLYFNQEVQPVQLSPSPFINPQTYIGSSQQIPYQSLYNQIPNYYNMGVMSYSQPTNVQYGPMIMKQNNFPTQILPTRLDVVDPNTGSNILLSRPSTPVSAPKRRSTLQIIDPVSKNEIDVYKIASEIVNNQDQIQNEKDKKDFKFDFNIINQSKEEMKSTKSLLDEIKTVEERLEGVVELEMVSKVLIGEEMDKQNTIEEIKETEELKVTEEILEAEEIKEEKELKKAEEIKEVEEIKEKEEIKEAIEIKEKEEIKEAKEIKEKEEIKEAKEIKEKEEIKEAEEIREIDKIKEIKKVDDIQNKFEEEDLKTILLVIKKDEEEDDQFTEVVNKKKKKQQTKMMIQEQKAQEIKAAVLQTKKEINNRHQNNNKKENREKNVKNQKSNITDDNKETGNNISEINRSGSRFVRNDRFDRNNHHRNADNQIPVDDVAVDKSHQSDVRNDNRNINRNESRNARFNRHTNGQNNERRNGQNNEGMNSDARLNQSRNPSIQNNQVRNANGPHNEERNASVQRNESRNPSIQERNTSIQRNQSRNASGHNEGRNARVQCNEGGNQNNEVRNASIQRNQSRNASGQNNDGRNASIQRNQSRNASGQNEGRNPRSQYNEGGNQNNEGRNSSIQRNQSRNASGQNNGNPDDNGLEMNENIDNRSATLPRMNNNNRNDIHNGYRQGYNRNRNNNHHQRNENQNYNGQQGINRTHFNKTDNHRSNNNNIINNRRDNEESAVYVNSNIKSEPFKTPFNYQRAFRKSSSPLYSERLSNVGSPDADRLEESPLVTRQADSQVPPIGDDVLIIDSRSDEVTVGGGRAFVVEVDVSSVMDVEEKLPSDEIETLDKVVVEVAEKMEIESIGTIDKTEIEPESKSIEENEILIIDSVVNEKELENEEKEGQIEIEEIQMEAEEIKPETEEIQPDTEEIQPVTEEIKSELKVNLESEEMKPEVEELKPLENELGRLTYYRDNLLALRGSQTLPDQLFLDPVLMEVITAKMQLINFLKKKEIFVPAKISRTDYLDFTRRHYNIRPKRLIRTENGYLPPQLRKADEDKLNLLKRNIKSILNKMTPENFEVCLNDLVNLEIDEEENMRCLIDEIFSKAIQEVSYSSIYARFCSEMSNARVGNYSFKALLLKSCQTMFDKPLHLQLEEVKIFWETKAANEKDERMKRLYESDIEEQVKKAKDKYFGNIRFFSELFLSNQLSWKIIISCADKLLMFTKDNNSLEAACRLMEICGKQLEKLEKERTNGDKAFSKVMNQFVVLSKNMDIEPRLRFKLKDIVDMRERSWELRGIQKAMNSVPKTLDQIKEDKQKEDSIKIKSNYNTNNNNNNNNNNINNNNNMRNRQQYPRPVMDTKKLLVNTQNLSENTVLGPSLRTQWNAGCQSKSTNSNGFSMIPYFCSFNNLRVSDIAYSRPRKQVSYDDIIDRPVVIKTQNKYAKLCEEEFEAEQAPVATKINNDEVLTAELFELIMNNLATVDKWKELFNPVEVVEKWFALMFERKIECRIRVGDYFHNLIEEGLLTFDQLVQGASVTMETIDDIIDDVPKFWEFLAQFLERFVKNEQSNISFFKHLFKDIEGYESDIEKCLKFTEQFSSNRIDSDIVGDLFRKFQRQL